MNDLEPFLHLHVELALQILDPHQVRGPRQGGDGDRPRRQDLAEQAGQLQRVVAIVDRLVADDDFAFRGSHGVARVHACRLSRSGAASIGAQSGFASVVSPD